MRPYPAVKHPGLAYQRKKDMKMLELVQRNIEGTGLHKLGEEKALGRTHYGFPILKGVYKQERDRLLVQSDQDRARGNVFQLKEGKFRLDIKDFFLIILFRVW